MMAWPIKEFQLFVCLFNSIKNHFLNIYFLIVIILYIRIYLICSLHLFEALVICTVQV